MKQMITSIASILLFTSSLVSCNKDNDDTHQPGGKESSVSGKIKDTRGNAITGATIVAEHTVWYDTHVNGTSDAGGNYKLNIPAQPAGSWTAKAQLHKAAWGQDYVFDLAADKADPFKATDDAERNFVWKLSGEREGTAGYYGAHADIYAFGISVPIEEVKLVFTPYPGETTLVDGSPAVVIERMLTDVAGTYMAKDIPVGKYTVKAMHDNKTLKLDYRHDSGHPATSKTVVFGKYGYLAATEYNITFWLSE